MSHLTSDTREVWVPVYYALSPGGAPVFIEDGPECVREEDAVAEARDWVSQCVDIYGTYHFAKIEHRIEPTYK